jgi:exodeoxyribonuclease V alpha subunit
VAAISRLTVLTGGPGTGKTTTVAKVLALLQHLAGPGVRIALAAPTGKAAARLQEAVRSGIRQLSEQHSSALTAPDATTLHRLLGPLPATATRFRHDRQRHLPFDVVVLDETSMVSLPMMARLLEALRPNARLVLVGDPDQLASVEAGAVLGDLVARAPVASWLPAVLDPLLPGDLPSGSEAVDALRNGVVRLTQVHRHGAEIGSLAEAIRTGDTDAVLGRLRAGDPAIGWYDTEGERPDVAALAALREDAEAAGLAMTAAAESGDAAAALRALDQHRVLVAHRRGRAGVTRWASQVEGWVAAATDRADGGRWYPGRPLLVTANDRDVGLYNGDTGVVIREPGGALVAAFGETEHPRAVRLHRVPSAEAVYAMTVHRGQGSAFDAVSVVLPPASSPLLARELLYTAVTRARSRVRIVGSEAAVRRAVTRPVRRASGLRDALG